MLLCNTDVTNCNTEIERREKREELDKEEEIIDATKVACSNKLQPVIEKWNSLNLSKLLNIKGGISNG